MFYIMSNDHTTKVFGLTQMPMELIFQGVLTQMIAKELEKASQEHQQELGQEHQQELGQELNL